MNFISALIILIFLTVGFHCVFLDISQDDLQSLTSDADEHVIKNKTLSIEALLQQNKERQELERSQKVTRNFERMIQLVNILGQVDTFLAERTKTILKKLALLAEDDNGYYRRRRS